MILQGSHSYSPIHQSFFLKGNKITTALKISLPHLNSIILANNSEGVDCKSPRVHVKASRAFVTFHLSRTDHSANDRRNRSSSSLTLTAFLINPNSSHWPLLYAFSSPLTRSISPLLTSPLTIPHPPLLWLALHTFRWPPLGWSTAIAI